jgi:DNA-binding PadR family transcriptional regulator
MTNLEYHVLLALAQGPLYGYAIKDAVAAESSGTIAPRAGSLYRVLARLMSAGLVKEVSPRGDVPAHPGLARKYYALTAPARVALLAESHRLKQVAAMAERRLGIASRSSRS